MICNRCGYESGYEHCPCGWRNSSVPAIFSWAILDDFKSGKTVINKLKAPYYPIVFFYGPVGVGKTYDAWGMLKYLNWLTGTRIAMIKGCDVPRLPSLIDEWKAPGYERNLLLIDELLDDPILYSIIDFRVTNRFNTICTANEIPNDQRLISRLNQGQTIKLTGDCWRENVDKIALADEKKIKEHAKWVEWYQGQMELRQEQARIECDGRLNRGEGISMELLNKLSMGDKGYMIRKMRGTR